MRKEIEDAIERIRKTAQEEIEKLEALAKVGDSAKTKGRAEEGGKYFFMDNRGCVCSYIDTNDEIDNCLYATGNYYLTKEDAEKALELQIIENELVALIKKINAEEYCPADFPDWNDNNQEKYFICFDYQRNIISSGSRYSTKLTKTKFYCYRDFLDDAINTIGKERLEKYLKEG